MNLIVLNGSPKGSVSVTMQYVHLLEQAFPQHTFAIHHVAQKIKKLERDETAFRDVIEAVRAADGVLWAFPLYYMLVHGGYKRFIELIWERGVQDAFAAQYAASLTTSIHFYDHTAHNYIHAVSDDLEMRYVDAFAAEMQDMMQKENRERLIQFGRTFLEAIERQIPTPRRYSPLVPHTFDYQPGEVAQTIDSRGKKIVLITDVEPGQHNLQHMIDRFKASFAHEIETVNLRELDIKGGCLGCLKCGYNNECAYEGKDGYIDFFKEQLIPADILVFAGAIRDRYLSAMWKTFFDRSFFKTHTPMLIGKQFGWIIAGPLGQTATLRQTIAAWTQMEHANLTGIVSDEYDSADEIDALLQNLARQLVHHAETGYQKPRDFLGVGGDKIFRDAIWGQLRTVFQADHRAYKRMGMYDFPQRNWRVRMVQSVFWLLFKIPGFHREFARRIKPQMIQPYQKILEEARSDLTEPVPQ